jgi:predicted nucleic acid-binding protein
VTSYVLDASVAVAAVRRGEPSHLPARARLSSLLAGNDDVIVPAIFDVEVTSALVRGQAAPAAVRRYLERDLAARRLVAIGPRAARAISAIAARTQLRAADAAYVWVASTRGLPLVTLDRDIERRAGGLCQVEAP